MSRHRIHCNSTLAPGATVVLEDSQAHYLGHVLRVRTGEEVTLFDGSGTEYRAQVLLVDRKRIELKTAETESPATESSRRVTLIQSLIRSERMDFCIQKTTELGVHEIRPVFTQRSVIKIPKARISKRTDHWRKIAISACEQSGRVKIPAIEHPMPLETAIDELVQSNTVLLVLDPWSETARSLHSYAPPDGASLVVCIGPEGGFTSDEIELLRKSNAVSVTCGPRILRSETAAVVAVATCQMLWGDW